MWSWRHLLSDINEWILLYNNRLCCKSAPPWSTKAQLDWIYTRHKPTVHVKSSAFTSMKEHPSNIRAKWAEPQRPLLFFVYSGEKKGNADETYIDEQLHMSALTNLNLEWAAKTPASQSKQLMWQANNYQGLSRATVTLFLCPFISSSELQHDTAAYDACQCEWTVYTE